MVEIHCIKHNIAPSAMGLFDVLDDAGPIGVQRIKIIVASGSEKPYAKKKYGMTEAGCFLCIATALSGNDESESPRGQKFRLTEQEKALLKQATSKQKDTPWS